jgi:hypothetical protein
MCMKGTSRGRTSHSFSVAPLFRSAAFRVGTRQAKPTASACKKRIMSNLSQSLALEVGRQARRAAVSVVAASAAAASAAAAAAAAASPAAAVAAAVVATALPPATLPAVLPVKPVVEVPEAAWARPSKLA